MNTEEKIMTGARKFLKARKDINIVFEHDQYWIFYKGKSYSVHEAEGIGTFNGYDFELIDDNSEE
jgi:23S rRNA-/tRNA-specific pseudouridylate synthase